MYMLNFALSMAALYYSQLVDVKATQYNGSYTYHSKVCIQKVRNTPVFSKQFLEHSLNNAGGRRDLHTE